MTAPRIAAALGLAFLLFGCASIEPSLKATAAPESGAGYVSGKFTRSNSGGFAFVLVDQLSRKEYAMSLGEDSPLPTDVNDQVVVVKVPPGRYSLAYWFTYGTLTKQRTMKFAVTNAALSAPFTVSSDSVVFLGNYSARTRSAISGLAWSVQPEIGNVREAQLDFSAAYPLLGKLNFSCHVCRY